MTIFVVVVAAIVLLLLCLGFFFSVIADALMAIQGIFSVLLWVIGRSVALVEAVIKVMKGKEME